MAGSTALVLSIPSIGLARTFDGGGRDATQALLKDFFKQNTDDVLARLSKDLARHSPVDPIAGNPNILMAQLVASDFAQGFFVQAATPVHGPASNLESIEPAYLQTRSDGLASHAYQLPLAYTIRGDDDPRRQFTIRMPIAEVDSAGSKSYQAGLAASFALPVGERRTLTPAVGYAVAGSEDLGALAGMASALLTST